MMVMTIKYKQSLKLRHEFKHNISYADDLELSSRLRKLFVHDEHANAQGIYRVSSLYFDTPCDRALRQKIDGVNEREKFRLRYYGEDTSFIRLEKKFKINGLCGKHSVVISRDEVEKILKNDIDFLLQSTDPLLIELYSKMKGQLLLPKSVVCYDREAFRYEPGNVRVTMDRKLRRGINPVNFLDPMAYQMDMSEGGRIMEVKYDAFLPQIVRLAVQIPNRCATSFSKYAACRRYD